jgi:hypothetical protein
LRRWGGPGITTLVGVGFAVIPPIQSYALAIIAFALAALWATYLVWPQTGPFWGRLRNLRLRWPITLTPATKPALELSPEEIAERRISSREFHIRDLLRLIGSDDTIDGWTFDTCIIKGPAVITNASPPRSPQKGRGSFARGEVWQVGTCHVDGDPESVLHEVSSGGARAKGVIHLVGCTYRRVTFSGIGIAGNAEELQGWREKCTFLGGD